MTDDTLGDRIRARRDAQLARPLAELKAHIDEHFAALHERLDKLTDNDQQA